MVFEFHVPSTVHSLLWKISNKLFYQKKLPNTTHFYGSFNDDLRSVIKSFGARFNHSLVALLLGLTYVLIDFLLMSSELRMNKLLVEYWGSFSHRTQQPENDANFNFIVEWKPWQKHIAECLNGNEAWKHHPVHHPSNVFLDILCANRFIRAVSWIQCSKSEATSRKTK